MPSFGGARYQRGHGIGSIFARIRAALPWLFRRVGTQALKTGLNIGQDMLSGKNFKDVVGSRLVEGASNTAQDIAPSVIQGIKESARDLLPQSGSGKRRRTTNRIVKKRKKSKRSSDIFNHGFYK